MHLKNLMSMSLQKATYLVPTIRLHIFHTFANQISKKLKFVRFERKFWKLFLNFGQKSISKLNFREQWAERTREKINQWREISSSSFLFHIFFAIDAACEKKMVHKRKLKVHGIHVSSSFRKFIAQKKIARQERKWLQVMMLDSCLGYARDCSRVISGDHRHS